MIRADKYFLETLDDILENGKWSKNPRTKWADGTPAHYKSIKQKSFRYCIFAGELPLISLRSTALKGAFYDMEAIYIKQTNIIEEMHPSIRPWWEPFAVSQDANGTSIGQTYGHTVKRYDLMNTLLNGMATNPEGRRHIINLWQQQQMIDDPRALVPCAFMTEWSVECEGKINFVDITLTQRSMDFIMTASINPIQYVKLAMMVCNHLSFVTGTLHVLRFFDHHIQDVHIYDRHIEAGKYLLEQNPSLIESKINLKCDAKYFYDHKFEDFNFQVVKPASIFPFKLEIAI